LFDGLNIERAGADLADTPIILGDIEQFCSGAKWDILGAVAGGTVAPFSLGVVD
jgi:hypothetical protein